VVGVYRAESRCKVRAAFQRRLFQRASSSSRLSRPPREANDFEIGSAPVSQEASFVLRGLLLENSLI